MKKILTIGGATQDIYLRYEGADYMRINQKNSELKYILFKSGEKIEVDNILYFTGGGATNSAISFKRQGFDVSCFTKIGKDLAGEHVISDLKRENIDYSNIVIAKNLQTGTSFIINTLEKERTIFAYRGANGLINKKEIPFDAIKNSDQIYITSLSHQSSQILPEIVQFAFKNKIKVAINPGISQLAHGTLKLKESLKYIDTLIMNSDEAKSFMMALIENDKNYKEILKSTKCIKNCSGEKENTPTLLETQMLHENYYFSIRKFFKEILKMGPKIVVITDGANGVYAANKNSIYFHPSIKTKIVDTLGAGDAFGSCFIGNILLEKSIQEALFMGITNSSSVIGEMGAKPGLLTKKELTLKKFNPKLIQEFDLA